MKNIEISIREETSRKLALDKNPSLHRFLKTAIELFCGYNFTEASYVIFKLLYENDKDTHNKVLKDFGFTLYSEESFDPCVEYLFIEESEVRPIAEEMQFQYMEAYPQFMKAKDCPGCEKELEALKNLLGDQHLLLYRAVESVWYSHKDAELVKNCVFLLLSDKPVNQAKGLEKLNHNYKHQQLLLPYAKEIGHLLKAMHDAYTKRLRIMAQDELSSPFAVLATIRDKVPTKTEPASMAAPATDVVTASKSTPADAVAPSDEQSCKKTIKCSLIKEYSVSQELSKFLDNKAALTFSIPNASEFWEQMAKLRKIGIDLNQLVDKFTYLLAVLSSHENLETATDSLIQADKDYKTAIANFRPEDMNTLHMLTAAGKAFADAKIIYTAAYESFVEHCNIFEKSIA